MTITQKHTLLSHIASYNNIQWVTICVIVMYVFCASRLGFNVCLCFIVSYVSFLLFYVSIIYIYITILWLILLGQSSLILIHLYLSLFQFENEQAGSKRHK